MEVTDSSAEIIARLDRIERSLNAVSQQFKDSQDILSIQLQETQAAFIGQIDSVKLELNDKFNDVQDIPDQLIKNIGQYIDTFKKTLETQFNGASEKIESGMYTIAFSSFANNLLILTSLFLLVYLVHKQCTANKPSTKVNHDLSSSSRYLFFSNSYLAQKSLDNNLTKNANPHHDDGVDLENQNRVNERRMQPD